MQSYKLQLYIAEIADSHLQTHRLHAGHGGEEEAMVQIVEELHGVVDTRCLGVVLKEQAQVVVPWSA